MRFRSEALQGLGSRSWLWDVCKALRLGCQIWRVTVMASMGKNKQQVLSKKPQLPFQDCILSLDHDILNMRNIILCKMCIFVNGWHLLCLRSLGRGFCSTRLWNKVLTALGNWGQCPKSGRKARPLNEEWKKSLLVHSLVEIGQWTLHGSWWVFSPPLFPSPPTLFLHSSFFLFLPPSLPRFCSMGPLTRVLAWVMWSHDLLAVRLSSSSVGHALTRAPHHLSINTATTRPSSRLLLFLPYSPPLQSLLLLKRTLPVHLCVQNCLTLSVNTSVVHSVCRVGASQHGQLHPYPYYTLKTSALLLTTTLFSGRKKVAIELE